MQNKCEVTQHKREIEERRKCHINIHHIKTEYNVMTEEKNMH